MELPGPYYNTKHQVSELESLIKKLPDASKPLRPARRGRLPGSARQLDSQQVQELIAGYEQVQPSTNWATSSPSTGGR